MPQEQPSSSTAPGPGEPIPDDMSLQTQSDALNRLLVCSRLQKDSSRVQEG